ncbi:SPOR domain-containing protein [Roseovarius sp. E0-M6]|uniref:SPOR domain-containing protein n=1 Tax=Roseovarius sp. E0-M6 TaxID=3127118 RepID=UPI00300F8228
MKLTRVIAIAVITASGALGLAQAQTLRDAEAPAEFPPSSFQGRQYVDSDGCVFIRAGIDGNVTWVPRVSRSRKLVCGYQPTLTARAKPEPAAKPAPKPEAVATAKPVVRTQAKPRTVAAAQPKPVRKPAPQLVRPAAPVAQGPVVQTAPAKKVVTRKPAKTVRRVAGASPCRGLSAVSARYLRGHNVRCGPQAEPPHNGAVASPSRSYSPAQATTTAVRRPAATPNTVQSPPVRVAPKHVYAKQRVATAGVRIPEGYKRVWMDGRLNPKRAHQYFEGKARMEQVWTKTLPRELIQRDVGPVVQPADPQTGYSRGYGSKGHGTAPVISSRGTAPAKSQVQAKQAQPVAQSKPASHSYVQAGVFATRAQAEQAAQRVARTGLTTRLGTLTKGGKSYSLVLAGPFRTQGALGSALARVRAAGFGNATYR